jgi:hypothetical protein
MLQLKQIIKGFMFSADRVHPTSFGLGLLGNVSNFLLGRNSENFGSGLPGRINEVVPSEP